MVLDCRNNCCACPAQWELFLPGDSVSYDVHEVGHPLLGVGELLQLPQVVQHVIAGLQHVLHTPATCHRMKNVARFAFS